MLELAARAAARCRSGAEFLADWLKAQEHNHSRWSAGKRSPEESTAAVLFARRLRSPAGVHRDSDSHRRHARRKGSALRPLHRLSDDRVGRVAGSEAMARCDSGAEERRFPLGRCERTRRTGGRDGPAGGEPQRHASRTSAAYRLIKQQNAFAFYTSRAGMIEALEYKGNSYNVVFPACTHPEHRQV